MTGGNIPGEVSERKSLTPIGIVCFLSALGGELLFSWARLAILQGKAFWGMGPSAWNDLLLELRSLLMAYRTSFSLHLS